MESQRKQFPLSRIRKTCHFVIELFTRPTCLFTLHKGWVDLSRTGRGSVLVMGQSRINLTKEIEKPKSQRRVSVPPTFAHTS